MKEDDIALDVFMKVRNLSEKIYRQLLQVTPGGVNSPVRAFKEIGILPLVVERGSKDTIWDVDGNPYIDYCGSWGALILGHANGEVIRPAIEQIQNGSSFGITTPFEQKLAEKIQTIVPSMENVRFVSSGTEASMSALRLARGYTGRSTIVKFNGNYHGHMDALLVQAGSGATHLPKKAATLGIPEETVKYTVSLPYNDIDACREFLRACPDVAAVIIEPVAGNMGLVGAKRDFLEMLRDETQKQSSLLIFDEVISGFRVGLKGVQGLHGITPDLTCLGKIIGGGFPAAAFGGRKDIMEYLAPLGPVYQAGTLSGNPVAMVAGYHTLSVLEQEGFYELLQEKTDYFLNPIEEYIRKKQLDVFLSRQGSMFSFFFGTTSVESGEDAKKCDMALFKKFFLHLLDRGIYFSPSAFETCFVSSAHEWEHLAITQQHILDFLYALD